MSELGILEVLKAKECCRQGVILLHPIIYHPLEARSYYLALLLKEHVPDIRCLKNYCIIRTAKQPPADIVPDVNERCNTGHTDLEG